MRVAHATIGVVSAIMLTCAFILIATNNSDASYGNEDIISAVAKIRADPNAEERTILTEALATAIRGMEPPSEINDASIDAVASLLADSDDSVRDWAAIAVSHIGPRASRALPFLRRALSQVEEDEGNSPIKGDSTSEPSICIAILKVGGPSVLSLRCRFLLGLEKVKSPPQAKVAITISENQIPLFIKVLQKFSDGEKLTSSSAQFQKLGHQAADVTIQMDRKIYFQADGPDDQRKMELTAYSMPSDEQKWKPAWVRLLKVLSSTFGPESITDEKISQ